MFQKIIGLLLLFIGIILLLIAVTPHLWVWFILSRVCDSALVVILIGVCTFFGGIKLLRLGFDYTDGYVY